MVIQHPVLVEPIAHKLVVCRPGPILHGLHQSMLDGIVMNIIHMLLKIVWIAYLMLPETALPYAALSLSLPRQALSGLVSTGLKVSTGKSFLDQHPPLREIVVALRQQAHRHHLEGPSLTNAPPRSAQAPSRQVIDKKTTAPICHHREEVIAALESRASIIGHAVTSTSDRMG